MSSAITHWDPVEGELPIETPDISGIRKGIVLPSFIRRIPPIAAVVAIIWTVVAASTTNEFPVVPLFATVIFFAVMFLADKLENHEGRQMIRRVELARRKGWSYTGKLMERVMAYQAVSISDGIERKATRVKSERALAVETLVPELTKVQVGSFAGAQFDGEFWGRSTEDGLPFWVAIGEMQMEAGLAADPNLRRDAHGGKGGFGVFFSLLGAYKLDRKTGIRAAIRPENLFNRGALDRDIKTESAEFNEAFHISGRGDAGKGAPVDQDVLRILTPATQATMLDLLKRYHTIGFVVDDDVLYFMAQDKLVGTNAHPDRIDDLLADIIAEFETAKFALKRYVE